MTPVDAAIVLLRVVLGLTLVAHGYNHLWGSVPRRLAGPAWDGTYPAHRRLDS